MTRIFVAVGMSLMMGCSETTETYDPGADWALAEASDVQAAPYKIELKLKDYGDRVQGTIHNAPPSSQVWVVQGQPGDGPCPNKLKGACMDVTDAVPFAVMTTTPDGEAWVNRAVPGMMFHNKGFQAIVVSRNERASMSELTFIEPPH
jgi:hypothetical protein